MMNSPFFRSYPQQQPSSSSRSLPVQQKSSPKVISVPVHFVSSEQPRTTILMLKDSAALKIQKVFRGFVVRKSVKKIHSIRNEVCEIEQRIEDIEVVDLIRKDAKERLRVNETLMSLLFKLDSIRGVDSGIRDLRKAVTRKAIVLQETVDLIAPNHHQTLDSPAETEPDNVCTSSSDQVTKASDSVDENLEAIEKDEDVKICNPADVIGEVEAMETSPAVNSGKKNEDLQKHKCENRDKENRAILEDLMGDNEKIMRLMNKISERNEMQTRMINSLSQRVEQLEKAERLRKKKKTHVCSRRRIDKESFCI